LGPGAHSHFSNLRFWDFPRPGLWAQSVLSGRLPWEGEVLGDQEEAEEEIFLGIRLREGLNLRKLEEATGKSASERLPDLGDLARIRSGSLVATRKGRLLNDFLARSLMDRFLDE
ncbi:MAG: coproporphyrinogen III oxidase, partial [Aeriscardovia sp.]|nr:coproporphyrinogen III oxidase [Aeriscardovia sp.]